MPPPVTTYTDTFYVMDPYAPPPVGSSLTAVDFTISDHRSDGEFGAQGRDSVDGVDIRGAYLDDTVTVEYPDGSVQTITGVTFYLADGREVFTPTDGTDLTDATLVSTSWTTTTGKASGVDLGLIPCFTPGVRIRTPLGARKIETLRVGDPVMTKDHGAQKIRWIGTRHVPGIGSHAPIRFAKGAIGNRHAMMVSPQHRMLVRDWRAEVYFGQQEVLIAAKHLVNDDTIRRHPQSSVTYIHLLFDRHEIIYAEGVATESFHPGEQILEKDEDIRRELETLFPELVDGTPNVWPAARRVLKAADGQLFE